MAVQTEQAASAGAASTQPPHSARQPTADTRMPDGPAGFGLPRNKQIVLGTVAVTASFVFALAPGEKWRPDMTVSAILALTIALALGLSPGIPKIIVYVMYPPARAVNEIRKALAGFVITLGTLWLGFGVLGPAGAATVAAQIVAVHSFFAAALYKQPSPAEKQRIAVKPTGAAAPPAKAPSSVAGTGGGRPAATKKRQ